MEALMAGVSPYEAAVQGQAALQSVLAGAQAPSLAQVQQIAQVFDTMGIDH
jgi:hypothetical protein